MVRKNSDYKAGSGDPFANFRSARWLRCSPETGILLRVQDKMSRIVCFLERGELAVSEESVQDSCIDAVNYLLILSAMLEERRECEEKTSHPLFSLPPYYGFGFRTKVPDDKAGERIEALLTLLKFTTHEASKEGGYGGYHLYVKCDSSSQGPCYIFAPSSKVERRWFDTSQCLAAEFDAVEQWLLGMTAAVKS